MAQIGENIIIKTTFEQLKEDDMYVAESTCDLDRWLANLKEYYVPVHELNPNFQRDHCRNKIKEGVDHGYLPFTIRTDNGNIKSGINFLTHQGRLAGSKYRKGEKVLQIEWVN